jgi:hypothetical protein
MPDKLTHNGIEYTRHYLSAIFPISSEVEFELLKVSILEVGLREPILLTPEGGTEVIDGWNRLRACLATGVEPRFTQIDPGADYSAVAIATNLARRHLTAGQKGIVAAQLAKMTSGFRTDIHNIAHPANKPAINWEDAQDGIAETDTLPKPTSTAVEHTLTDSILNIGNESSVKPDSMPLAKIDRRPRSLLEAARLFGISRATTVKARQILASENSQLIEGVKSGVLSLEAASTIAKAPRELQEQSMMNHLLQNDLSAKQERNRLVMRRRLANLIKKGKPFPKDTYDDQIHDAVSEIMADLLDMVLVVNQLLQEKRNWVLESDVERIKKPISNLDSQLKSN